MFKKSRSMGFVIQVVSGKAEAWPRTGVRGRADNAAGDRLGAKTAIEGFLNTA
ncbi:hypothetical protein [Pseudonocardia eucalypti]